MGNTDSNPKHTNADERKVREEARKNIVTTRKKEIDSVQQQILSSSANSTAITTTQDVVQMIKISETAKHQLDRGGGVLTKSDLVAILIALEPRMRANLNQLNETRVSDLNTAIRSIVYDPKRIVGTSQHNNPLQLEQNE